MNVLQKFVLLLCLLTLAVCDCFEKTSDFILIKRFKNVLWTRAFSLSSHHSFAPNRYFAINFQKRMLCTLKKGDCDINTDTRDTGPIAGTVMGSGARRVETSKSMTPAEAETVDHVTQKSPYRLKSANPSASTKHQRDVNSPYRTTHSSNTGHSDTNHSSFSSSTQHHSSNNPTNTSAQASRVWNYTTSMNNSIKDIEQSLMKRIHESATFSLNIFQYTRWNHLVFRRIWQNHRR